jgi:hypothetical protein
MLFDVYIWPNSADVSRIKRGEEATGESGPSDCDHETSAYADAQMPLAASPRRTQESEPARKR